MWRNEQASDMRKLMETVDMDVKFTGQSLVSGGKTVAQMADEESFGPEGDMTRFSVMVQYPDGIEDFLVDAVDEGFAELFIEDMQRHGVIHSGKIVGVEN